MISAVASFLWSCVPFIYASLTILFLVLLRLWTRDTRDISSKSDLTKTSQKLGDKISETTKNTSAELKDITEGMSVSEKLDDIADSSESLDAQFYGELFLAGLAAGVVVKFGW